MLDLAKLNTEVTSKLKEVELAYTEIEEAGKTGDENKMKVAKDVFDAKSVEFEALKAKVSDAQAHQDRVALARKIAEMAQPASPTAAKIQSNGIAGVMSTPAVPIDYENEALAHRDAFTKWMQGSKSLSDGEMGLLTPKSEKMISTLSKSSDPLAAKSVVIPPSLALQCLGANYVRAFGTAAKMQSKTIMSVNNAVTNPSLANLLVPQEFRAQLQMLPFDEPTLLQKVTVIPSVTGNVTFPGLAQTDSNEFGGVSFSWISEGASKPETEPIFTQIEIPTFELAGYTEISERALSRSAIPLEALLVSIFKPALNYTLDAAIVSGTGVGQPTGILPTAGIRNVARAAALGVSDADLVNLKHAVKPVHRKSAQFLLSDSVELGLELAADTLGRPLFRASTANGPFDRLVGYPYDVATNCPVIGTRGDVIYGNMKWYFLVMEEEITVARSEHYKFRNNVVAFKVFVVVGGRVMQPRAFSVLANADS